MRPTYGMYVCACVCAFVNVCLCVVEATLNRPGAWWRLGVGRIFVNNESPARNAFHDLFLLANPYPSSKSHPVSPPPGEPFLAQTSFICTPTAPCTYFCRCIYLLFCVCMSFARLFACLSPPAVKCMSSECCAEGKELEGMGEEPGGPQEESH